MKQKIRVIRKKIKRKPYIILSLYIMFVLMCLTVVASYTWFSMSRVPKVSDMSVYITSTSGLKLSANPYLDEEEWLLQLPFQTSVKNSSGAIVPMTSLSLRPITWSENDQKFWAAAYSADGRLMDQEFWKALRDSSNANNKSLDGYYIKSVFYARCGMNADVTLSPAVVLDEQGTMGSGTYVIGTPGWSVEDLLNLNNGKGAESSIRFGFRTTPMMITQAGVLTATGARSDMVIYEPNADRHVSDAEGYIDTPSMDGTDTLVPRERLIAQEATGWTNLDPAEIDKIKLSPGDFYEDPLPTLFSVKPGQIIQIEMYIWLEGQDVDCINAMNGAQIIANIQFAGQSHGQSGMVSIHDNP